MFDHFYLTFDKSQHKWLFSVISNSIHILSFPDFPCLVCVQCRAFLIFALTKLSKLDRDGSLSGVFRASFKTSLITVGILLFETFKLSKLITHSIVALVYCCEKGLYNCTVLSSKKNNCTYSMEDSISLMILLWSLIWFPFSITHSLWNDVNFCSLLIC